jgi:dTMP kinase
VIAPPLFVSFEGVDGAGKTTQARLYAAWLRELGLDVVELREPGGTYAGEQIRSLVLDARAPIGARSEALLFAAARAQAVDEIVAPALARGAHVVADRFVDSSLVYQGAVRGLGVEAVRAINAFALAGLLPDRTVLLELPPASARARRSGQPDDRIEAESAAFHEQVAQGYLDLLAAEPARIVRISAGGPSDLIAQRVREAIGGD